MGGMVEEQSATVDTVVFDIGGVIIDWNPRYLYDKLITDPAARDRFLTEVCSPQWNARSRGWACCPAPQHPPETPPVGIARRHSGPPAVAPDRQPGAAVASGADTVPSTLSRHMTLPLPAVFAAYIARSASCIRASTVWSCQAATPMLARGPIDTPAS
jgi:hypothetical protein